MIVEFAGEERRVNEHLSFGRTADLCLDTNEFMHRCVGEFFSEGDLWWLRNRGSRIHLILIDADGKRVELPPGAVQALSAGQGTVQFRAGQANYELTYECPVAGPDGLVADRTFGATETRVFGVDLTPREVDYLVTFARSRFDASVTALPSYAEVAAVWGVSVKTLDNTLQGLRRKVKEAGIRGVDSLDDLVTLAIRQGMVGRADMAWAALDGVDAPRPAASGPRFSSAPGDG